YDAVEIAPYSDDQIAEIDAQYAREKGRGANPRGGGAVKEGAEAGRLGMGLYRGGAARLGCQGRPRIPRFFHRDELNIPDVMQRVHWDPDFARRSGNPTTFDYGRMGETGPIHLCTDG